MIRNTGLLIVDAGKLSIPENPVSISDLMTVSHEDHWKDAENDH